MSKHSSSTDDMLQRELEESLEPPSLKDRFDRPTTRKAALLVAGVLAGMLAFIFLPGGKDATEEQAVPERESLPPQRIMFDDPDAHVRDTMHGLVAPVIEAVTGVASSPLPELSPEELARLEYLAFQIGGPIRIDTEQRHGTSGTHATSGGAGYAGSGSILPRRQRSAKNGHVTSAIQTGYEDPSLSVITSTVVPKTLWHNQTRILEGKRIPAILETPIDTTLPGPVRAIFTEDVYSESGDTILIPRYSEALGSAGNVQIRSGQDRVGIVWHRLLLRTNSGDGIVEVRLDSPVTDHLGRTGIKGSVQTHFWARFGNALLFTLIGTTASNIEAARSDAQNAQQAYIEGLSESFSDTAQESLRDMDVHEPTITVPRATPITIVAAKDILFGDGQVEGVR